MKLVINPDELGQDPEPGLKLAASLEARFIELRTAYGANALLLGKDQIRKLARLIQSYDLKVAALASPLFKWTTSQQPIGKVDRFGFPTTLGQQEKKDFILRSFDTAHLLDTTLVRIFSNLSSLKAGQQLPFHEDALLEFAISAAKSAGVDLLLENEPVCTIASASSLFQLFDSPKGEEIGLWLDFANLHEAGDATAEVVTALASHVRYTHVKDYSGSSSNKVFCAAGAGGVPLRLLISALLEAGSDPFFAIESHVRQDSQAAIVKSVEFLRDNWGELNENTTCRLRGGGP